MGFLERTGGKRQEYFFRSIRFIQRYGIGFLLVSKFVPGVASLACPAAGIVNMSVSQILGHERVEPCFLGHQYCLVGLFRNFRIPRYCGKHSERRFCDLTAGGGR